MAQQQPFRANNKITQQFNDGLVKIYNVEDTAAPGYLPVETLTEKASLRYEERKLGLKRFYESKQTQTEATRVIRVPKPPVLIENQDIAETEDGRKYRVQLVQTVPGIYPPCLDLTLERFTQGAEP